MRLGLISATLMLLGSVPLEAQNPEQDRGRRLYLGHCAHCHGLEGEGGRGTSLTTGYYRFGSTERDLFLTIRGGLPGGEMPATRLPDAEIREITRYIIGLGRAGALETLRGDPRSGQTLYGGKGNCAACHTLARRGGSLGPPLDGIGLRRSLRFLRESLVNPGAHVPDDYRPVTVVTRTGEEISGLQLNEDDYSLQLRDLQENLRSFRKRDLKQWSQPERSLMPAYEGVFSELEIDDLVAYLASLRRVR
jgi:putative heme-binding domain-containing protein